MAVSWGKDGALTQYAKSQYYMNYLCRAEAFLASFKQEDQDVRNALNSERIKQIHQNRELFTSTVETIKLCRAQRE